MVGFPKDITDPENVQPLKTTAAAKTGTGNPGPAQALDNLRKATKPPNTLTMAVDAVRELAGRRGVSVIAIRSHVVSSHPDVDQVRLKRLLKNALAKGLATGVLVRPNGVAPEISPAVGRYKLGKPVATNAKKLKLKAAVVDNVEEALVEARPVATKKATAPKAPKAGKASAAVTVDASTKRAKKQKVDLELEAATASSTNTTKLKPAKPKNTTVEKKKVVRNRNSLGILTLGSKNAGKAVQLNAKAPRAKKTTARQGAKVLPAVVEADGDDESHGTKDAKVPKKTKTKVVKTAVVKFNAEAKDKKPRAVASKKETAAKKTKAEQKPVA
ncbi:uncharacterized protein LOC116947457 [Petromyzon marinus]|uniref:Protein B4 n=1 Tax=Petromyzon marinus TaxID=7757 RepID=A0AAJ7X2P6_PETMA|nr:protein B4 [Petromyzon marinus]